LLGSEFNLTADPYWDWDTFDFVDPFTNVLYTQNEDSALNGPWYAYGDAPTNVTVSGNAFAPALLRDAFCHWYLAKTLSLGGVDSRYDTHGARLINAKPKSAELKALVDHLWVWGDNSTDDRFVYGHLRYSWPGGWYELPYFPFITTNFTSATTDTFTVIEDWQGLGLNKVSITNLIGIGFDTNNAFTNMHLVTCDQLTSVRKYVQEMVWTIADESHVHWWFVSRL
jgi:hypothetical protein